MSEPYKAEVAAGVERWFVDEGRFSRYFASKQEAQDYANNLQLGVLLLTSLSNQTGTMGLNRPRATTMTRRDIEREYTVQDGAIASQGKFEGEPVFAPYFWDLALHGEADQESDECEYTFNINADQRRLFPELGQAREVTLVEFDNGNVVTTTRE